MMRRHAAGEKVSVETIGKICEVIADIAASQPAADQPNVFQTAAYFLAKFSADIASGEYGKNAERVDHTSHGQARH